MFYYLEPIIFASNNVCVFCYQEFEIILNQQGDQAMFGKTIEYDHKLGEPEILESPKWVREIVGEIVQQNTMILKTLTLSSVMIPKDSFLDEILENSKKT